MSVRSKPVDDGGRGIDENVLRRRIEMDREASRGYAQLSCTYFHTHSWAYTRAAKAAMKLTNPTGPWKCRRDAEPRAFTGQELPRGGPHICLICLFLQIGGSFWHVLIVLRGKLYYGP